MESGSQLYDSRNSVKLSRPGRKNRERRAAAVIDGTAPLKLMTHEPKVAMTSACRFCGNAFRESRAICPFCITCQYCGLVPTGSRECEFCGNKDLDKKKNPRRRPKYGPHGLHKPRKNKMRVVRRLGPERLSRPGRTQRGEA